MHESRTTGQRKAARFGVRVSDINSMLSSGTSTDTSLVTVEVAVKKPPGPSVGYTQQRGECGHVSRPSRRRNLQRGRERGWWWWAHTSLGRWSNPQHSFAQQQCQQVICHIAD